MIEKEYSTVKNLILKENISIEEFLLNYFTNELRNNPDENTTLKLTNIIVNNPNLLSKSYPFISVIIRNLIDNNLDKFFNNLDNLKKCNNLYISLMNKLNDDVLNEIIINIFDNHFNLYFESITKISNLSKENSKKYFSKYYKCNEDYEKHAIYILFGENLKLFEKCLNFLDEIYNNSTNGNNIINNEILCKLYCISYIKIYLNKFVYLNHNYNNYMDIDFNMNEITDVLKGNKSNNSRKIIKLYLFKIFFHLLNQNYYNFVNYHYANHGITLLKEFEEIKLEKKESALNYYLMPKENEIQDFRKVNDEFEICLFDDFNKRISINKIKTFMKFKDYFKDNIEQKGIDNYYIISTNLILSKIFLFYVNNSIGYKEFSSFSIDLFNEELKIKDITKNLILLFSSKDKYNNIIESKLKNQLTFDDDLISFEMLLYSLRICLQTNSYENNYCIYSGLITKEFERIINENCIPGNNILDKTEIKKIPKSVFEYKYFFVRKLSIIGYRLLNFIYYSHLFYSNCLGIISDDNLKKYLCDGMTCLQMLLIDWNILTDELKTKGIIIQIFMNLIFFKLTEKLKNCKSINSTEKRDIFEEEIEHLLEISYKEYEAYYKKYMEFNEEFMCIDKYHMKSLMLENYDINFYDKERYPFYKYFLMTAHPSLQDFINELKKIPGYEKKYPLLTAYISVDNKIKDFFKCFSEFNEFCNYLINKYSYKISREEALERHIYEEEIYVTNQDNFKDKYNRFKKMWVYLEPYSLTFNGYTIMYKIDMDKYQILAYILNDDEQFGKGKYISSIYQHYINLQNKYLLMLIKSSNNSNLSNYIKENNIKIDVQKATKNEILNFDNDEKFIEIIFDNCKRNIITKDNKINYLNYKQYIYDFDSIEFDLGKKLLANKAIFNEKIKYITYCYEGFRKSKASALINFISSYGRLGLKAEKKQKIYDFIKYKLKNEINKILKIYFSLQLLIDYLTENNQSMEDDLNKIIMKLPNTIILCQESIDFSKNIEIKII